MTSVNSTVTQLQNNTATVNYENSRDSVGSSEIDSDGFLQLLITQIQNQDPLNPTDSTEFLNQQAMLSQLSELRELNDNQTAANEMMEASSMIGMTVTITDPDDSSSTITGVVTEAQITSSGSNIVINDTAYPISLVQSITTTTTTEE